MPFTNLALGTNWPRDEWPEHVDVMHEGACDSLRYVPERTCSPSQGRRIDGTTQLYCSECGYEVVNYCPICGAKVMR